MSNRIGRKKLAKILVRLHCDKKKFQLKNGQIYLQQKLIKLSECEMNFFMPNIYWFLSAEISNLGATYIFFGAKVTFFLQNRRKISWSKIYCDCPIRRFDVFQVEMQKCDQTYSWRIKASEIRFHKMYSHCKMTRRIKIVILWKSISLFCKEHPKLV